MKSTENTRKLLTVTDIMDELGVGRHTATRLLMDPRCPTFPRPKGGKILVTAEGWAEYMRLLNRTES